MERKYAVWEDDHQEHWVLPLGRARREVQKSIQFEGSRAECYKFIAEKYPDEIEEFYRIQAPR